MTVPPRRQLTAADLEALSRFDTCTLANAIETFKVRLRNEGYTGPDLHCNWDPVTPLIGYAVTATVKSSNPPANGGSYCDRTDWWTTIDDSPLPRVAVIEDIDEQPGIGAVAGEIHSAILRRLGCTGLVTNGAVRDVPDLRRMNFTAFSCSRSVSHAYVHMVDFGIPVTICGLRIEPGDLLYGDCHGVLSIPAEIAPRLPEVASELLAHERRIIDLCRSPAFSIERLKEEVQDLS